MNKLQHQIDEDAAKGKAKMQAETDAQLVTDSYSVVAAEMETAALEEFNNTITLVREMCDVDRTEAIRRMVMAEELDASSDADVEKFLWLSGLSPKLISEIRAELL